MGILRGALFIIGTSIGAGFLSGAELVRFFHTERFFLPLLFSCVLFFLACTLFLSLGKKYGGFRGATDRLFGRAGKGARVAVSLCSFIPCAGMLAGLDALLPAVKPLASVAGLLLVIVCLKFGMKGISLLNSVLVPVLVIFILFSAKGGTEFFYPVFARAGAPYFGGILYAFMNVFLAAPVLMDAGKEMKHAVFSSLIAAAVILICAVCILGRIYREGAGAINAEMPFLYALHGKKAFQVAAALAILTSLASALYPLTELCGFFRGKKKYAAKCFVYFAAFCLSRFGLTGIVRFLYPALGGFGILLSALCIFYDYLFKKHHKEVHSRGK